MGKPIRAPIYFILFIGDSWDIQLNKAFKLVHIIYKFAKTMKFNRKKGSCNRNKSRAQNNAGRKLVFQPIPSFLH